MEASTPTAWQPLTPRGVAAFARAPLRRLLLVQFIVALCVAAGMTWFFYNRYVPVVSSACANLPSGGEIRGQKLSWPDAMPMMLAENRFLALNADPARTGKMRSVAHVQVELTREVVVVHSLFGYAELRYPPGWIITLNRETAAPFWGAWQPALVAGVLLAVLGFLFVSWFGLATCYVIPVWLLGLYTDRQINWRGSWKLSGAALMPGALLMLVGLSFYDLGVMDLTALLFVFGAHFLLGWVYVGLGLAATPRDAVGKKVPTNPFGAAKQK